MARWRACADAGLVDYASVGRFGLSLRVRMLGGCRLLGGEVRLGGRGGMAFLLFFIKVGVRVVVGGEVLYLIVGRGRRVYLCLAFLRGGGGGGGV